MALWHQCRKDKTSAAGATGTNRPTPICGRVNCDSHIRFEAGVLVFCRHSFVHRRHGGEALREKEDIGSSGRFAHKLTATSPRHRSGNADPLPSRSDLTLRETAAPVAANSRQRQLMARYYSSPICKNCGCDKRFYKLIINNREPPLLQVERARSIPRTHCIASRCGSKANWRWPKLQIRCHATVHSIRSSHYN
jgi:hypothetical protein